MPRYDYKCSDCEHVFEAAQSIKDEPLRICPECKGPIRRLISKNVGIAFKGGGFYVTDAKDGSKPAESSK
ncbi:FmdB family transcriptional regulator [Candidatus Marinamargulisbacteria bacterium SCGC AAA071-K20]|nr:FmdB family transcriptional regulator [Candidatus Marinamargulisbacteria bacterium SCGC AAA071-K20]